MKDVVGSPGTWSSLALRVAQCMCASASIAAMAFAHGSSNYTAFWALDFSMELLFFWSFFRACVDVEILWNKLDPHDPETDMCPIFIGDWLMAILSLASVSASAGVAIYLERLPLLQDIPTSLMQSIRSFGHPGVHGMVIHICICRFLVLAAGFIFLTITCVYHLLDVA